MSKKKYPIPKVDLSKYDSSERLDSTIEQIIVQGLVAFNCEPSKVAKHFNISEETVNKIFIKYYSQLVKIKAVKDKDDRAEDSINIAIELYENHLKEIQNNINVNSTKMLNDRVTRNINSITDRLLNIKENNSRTYDTTVNKLSDSIIKVKTLEKLENGEITDSSIHDENVSSVSEKLFTYRDNNYRKKRVRVVDTQDNTEHTYESITSTADAFATTMAYVTKIIEQELLYKNRFRMYYADKKEDNK